MSFFEAEAGSFAWILRGDCLFRLFRRIFTVGLGVTCGIRLLAGQHAGRQVGKPGKSRGYELSVRGGRDKPHPCVLRQAANRYA